MAPRWRRALLWVYALAIGLFGAGLGTALVVVVWRSPTRGQTLIELLKVFVSWPSATLVLGLVFGWVFRDEIRKFLAAAIKFKFGALELELKQVQVSAAVEKIGGKDSPGMLAGPGVYAVAGTSATVSNQLAVVPEHQAPSTAPDLATDTETSRQDLERQLQQARAELLHWWLRFLDAFLVPNTRIALAVLQNTPMTRETYHQFWEPRIPSLHERDAMLDALISQHPVEIDNATMHLRVTPVGQWYLRYLLRFAQPPEAPDVRQEPSKPAAP